MGDRIHGSRSRGSDCHHHSGGKSRDRGEARLRCEAFAAGDGNGDGGMVNPLSTVDQVYLACGSTDMRKSIDGLAAVVQEEFQLNPFAPALFVFCNRQRNKLKILHWEHNGFWLHYRRLERGTFPWPEKGSTMTVGKRELNWLLDGLSIHQKKAHPVVNARFAV
jgi:transposase